jgi:hypothetical protein
MASPAIISWNAPTHIHKEKTSDWYWSVGIITLAIAVVCFIFGQIIPGLVFIMSSVALVLFYSKPPRVLHYEINDRGILVNDTLYPFLSLESFCIPHDYHIPRLLVKSRKTFMPLISIMIDEVDPESVREVMLRYIAETELREPMLHHVIESLGF